MAKGSKGRITNWFSSALAKLFPKDLFNNFLEELPENSAKENSEHFLKVIPNRIAEGFPRKICQRNFQNKN